MHPPFPQGRTTALLAYILDSGTEHAADPALMAELVDRIVADPVERARLISATTLSQSPEVRPQVIELLGQRLSRLRDTLEEDTDRDEVIGVWSQRVAGGALLSGAVAVIGGVAGGAWAVAALGLPLVAGLVTTKARHALRVRARKSRRACEETERLIESLRG